jgi:hypothetical protein
MGETQSRCVCDYLIGINDKIMQTTVVVIDTIQNNGMDSVIGITTKLPSMFVPKAQPAQPASNTVPPLGNEGRTLLKMKEITTTTG